MGWTIDQVGPGDTETDGQNTRSCTFPPQSRTSGQVRKTTKSDDDSFYKEEQKKKKQNKTKNENLALSAVFKSKQNISLSQADEDSRNCLILTMLYNENSVKKTRIEREK